MSFNNLQSVTKPGFKALAKVCMITSVRLKKHKNKPLKQEPTASKKKQVC